MRYEVLIPNWRRTQGVSRRHEADLTQEIMFELFRSLRSYAPAKDRLRTWLVDSLDECLALTAEGVAARHLSKVACMVESAQLFAVNSRRTSRQCRLESICAGNITLWSKQ